jgi:uncharacterized protein YndB with AHSA1/START domain
MIEVTASADIARPAPEVFDYVADMANNPRWQQGQESCTWTSAGPIGVGSTYDQRARFLGREVVSSFEVVEYEPGRRIRIRTIESTMPLDITREVEPLDAGRARVTATIRGGPAGLLRLLDPLTRRMVQRTVRSDYARLAALLGPAG